MGEGLFLVKANVAGYVEAAAGLSLTAQVDQTRHLKGTEPEFRKSLNRFAITNRGEKLGQKKQSKKSIELYSCLQYANIYNHNRENPGL